MNMKDETRQSRKSSLVIGSDMHDKRRIRSPDSCFAALLKAARLLTNHVPRARSLGLTVSYCTEDEEQLLLQ